LHLWDEPAEARQKRRVIRVGKPEIEQCNVERDIRARDRVDCASSVTHLDDIISALRQRFRQRPSNQSLVIDVENAQARRGLGQGNAPYSLL
jgi:hypothetical protein